MGKKTILVYDTKRPNKNAFETSPEGYELLRKAKGNRYQILTDVKPIGPTVIEIKKPELGQKVVVEPVKTETKKGAKKQPPKSKNK